jgi:hypothetical protein
MRMRGSVKRLLVAASLTLLPLQALAQGTLTGTVRDASGAVLPGVTVEAASPALIEKVRTVVSDGTGQWRIVDLRAGTYTVTFTIEGFTTVRRDGIELTGSATLTVPVDMRVGNLQETITVSGETPVVDVQSTRRETVLNADVLQTLPATRSYGALLNSIPGLTIAGGVSAQTTPTMTLFTAHGGDPLEGRITIDGLTVAAAFNGGGVSSFTYDVTNVEEMQVLVSGGLGEAETGGPSMNLIPRTGGNSFRGSAFWSGAGDWSRGENIDDYLRSIGITRGPALITAWDVNGSFGGPLKRDRLWFFASVRSFESAQAVEGVFANAYAGDATKWGYLRDDTVEARNSTGRDTYLLRLAAQVTPRNRVTFSQENQYLCEGSSVMTGTEACRPRGSNWIAMGTTTSSPEATPGFRDYPYYVTQATWASPLTNRVLLEAGFSRFHYLYAGNGQVLGHLPSDGIVDLIPVTEQRAIDQHRANFTYRAVGVYGDNDANPNNWRGSVAYVTGAHNLKVGIQGAFQRSDRTGLTNSSQLAYRFDNGVPNQFTYRLPTWQTADRTLANAVYIQDQWTVRRLTLQAALRYDQASSWSPAEHNGTTEVSPFNAAPIAFERTVSVSGYHDLSPRLGAAYDLFGNGKTAVKVNGGRYLGPATNDRNYTVNNPANRIVQSVSRNWVDGNGNYVVDCDPLNPAMQVTPGGDTCAALGGNSLNFGKVGDNLTQVNPAILGGWGARADDWQFGVSVQQQLMPRVSVDVGYNRRSWGNFTVTDNQVRSPQDYEAWTVTAPDDPRLPGGGGYTITQYAITPAAFARASQNYVTFESDFGAARSNYWHGVDVAVNARLRNGLVFQGGTSTGREVEDTCASVVNIDSPDPRNCRQVEPFTTTFRGLATYTLPKVDVLVSASLRSLPGSELSAAYVVPNTIFLAQLGRLPAGGTATGNQTVQLLDSNQLYAEDRLTQVDMRFAKVLRFGARRADVGVDLYNLFNSNTAVGYDGTYDYGTTDGGGWLQPTSIVQPRFVRLNLTVSF